MKTIMVLAAIATLALCSMVAGAQDPLDKERIQFLINSVENLDGAKFIRNGTEHDGKEAADHLRMKLKTAGGKVQTADDFILLCASKSYITGKKYIIKYSDGKTITSEEYFRGKLKEYKETMK